jgi:hypothetical protein
MRTFTGYHYAVPEHYIEGGYGNLPAEAQYQGVEFWKSVELERVLNERRETLGKDRVYLTRFGKPLDEAVGEAQPTLPGFSAEACDGWCMT